MAISWDLIGIWVAAFYTIGIYTLTIKVNPWYRFVEYTFVGLAVGYAMVMALRSIQSIAIDPIAKGNVSLIIPLVLGLLLFTRFIKSAAAFSRWGIALLIGVGLGLGARGAVDAMLLKQIQATFISPIAADALKSFNNILIIIMVVTVIFYFIFVVQQKPGTPSGILAKIARIAMMATFGTAYGNTITFRINLFIERMMFLIHDWLGL